jgi:bifunctional DNase/RNase
MYGYSSEEEIDSMKIRLKFIELNFNQVQTGAYAVRLAEERGKRQVSIIIGTHEAQAIAIYTEGLRSPRPLTYDIFISFMDMLNVSLKEIYICRHKDGIFFTNLIFKESRNKEIHIDSRVSDAIALALRTGAIITIDEKVMKETSFVEGDSDYSGDIEDMEERQEENPEQMEVSALQQAMEEAVETEDYERASYLRDIINSRKK